MIFLTDHIQPQPIKDIAIDNPVTGITDRKGSHKGAWARLLRRQMIEAGFTSTDVIHKNPWNPDYDVVVLDHGMEFTGKFNLFSGLTEEICRNLIRMVDHEPKIRFISADIPCPDYASFLLNRKEEFSWLDKPTLAYKLREFQQRMLEQKMYFDRVYASNKIVIGDSHALSQWRPGHEMARHDGHTMYGACQRGLSTYVNHRAYSHIVWYFGNIDIRHHICRQPEPLKAIGHIVLHYCAQIRELQLNYQVRDITLIQPLPIEDESRKLPQTGYYKGTPFYGTWEWRNCCRQYMSDCLEHYCITYGWEFYRHPDCYVDRDGKLKFSVMEVPRSVHLSPEWYPYDLDTGQLNERIK